jgi:hypothetical protein
VEEAGPAGGGERTRDDPDDGMRTSGNDGVQGHMALTLKHCSSGLDSDAM